MDVHERRVRHQFGQQKGLYLDLEVRRDAILERRKGACIEGSDFRNVSKVTHTPTLTDDGVRAGMETTIKGDRAETEQ